MKLSKTFFALLPAIGFAGQLYAQETAATSSSQPKIPPRPSANSPKAEQGSGNRGAGQSYDPMRFYRQNPELMKRYFPHLFQEGMGTAPAEAQENGQVLNYFSFKGGTAQELADSLKKQFQPPPNIIISPKLKDTLIPEFELQNVTLADMFQALNSLSEEKSVHWQLSGSSEPIWVLNPTETADTSNVQSSYPRMMNAIDPVTGLPINTRTCRILPVGKYLKQYKIEDITTAVKTAWSMMGDEAGAEMKYHTDTRLLIVVGNQQQIDVLTQVLASLEQNPESAPKTSEIQIPVKPEAR